MNYIWRVDGKNLPREYYHDSYQSAFKHFLCLVWGREYEYIYDYHDERITALSHSREPGGPVKDSVAIERLQADETPTR